MARTMGRAEGELQVKNSQWQDPSSCKIVKTLFPTRGLKHLWVKIKIKLKDTISAKLV